MEIYVVKNNDTLESIANKYNIPTSEIVKANNLVYPYEIQVNQALNIPTVTSNIFDYYKIEKGDTLYSIASKNSISVNTLAAINGLDVNEYIYPGQTILVPKQGIQTFITSMGDTIQSVSKSFNTTPQALVYNNSSLYLLPDQLIIYRK